MTAGGGGEARRPFAPMFERSRYLMLLHPLRSGAADPGVVEALEVADAAASATATLAADLCALLADRNWRGHLVAAAVVVRTRCPDPAVRRALWDAIDRPSWVSPQLAVAANVVDPEFEREARARFATASPKTVAALAALARAPIHAPGDLDHGDVIAAEWRTAMLVQYASDRS
jgi:hypothetical protein